MATVISTSFSKSDASSDIDKYGTLIEVPLRKAISNSIIGLYSYLDNIVSPIPAVHMFITVIRLMQYLGPALFPSFTRIWSSESIANTLSILSISFHLLPIQARTEVAALTVGWVYIAISIAGILIVLFSALYYKHNSKLHPFVCNFIYFFTITFGYIGHPINAQFTGGQLTRLITGELVPTPSRIALVVLSIILILSYTWFIKQYYCLSVVFRPTSLSSVDDSVQEIVLLTTVVNTFFLSACSRLGRYPIIVLCSLTLVIYCSNFRIFYFYASFTNNKEAQLFMTATISCVICTAIGMAALLVPFKIGEIAFFGILIILILSYAIAVFLVTKKNNTLMAKLDEYEEDKSIEIFQHWQIGPAAVTGLIFAHPSILNASLFKSATDQWPEDPMGWYIYAKFSSIYPEMQSTLGFIQQTIAANHLKPPAKYIVSQISALSKTRENNLSADLKLKIAKISKNINKVKQRIRNIWDLILQGNTSDMESSINAAYNSVSQVQQDLEHLKLQYPNNRFVARQFTKFLHDVLADSEQTKAWKENLNLLQRGFTIRPDVAHQIGIAAFPCLPPTLTEQNCQIFTTTLDMGDQSEEFMFDEEDVDANSTVIFSLIKSHKVKVVTAMKVVSCILFVLCILFPGITLISLFPSFSSKLSTPLSYLYGAAVTRNLNMVFPAFVNRFIMEEMDDPNDPTQKYAQSINYSKYSLESFGGQHTARGQIGHLLNLAVSFSALLAPVRTYAEGDAKINRARTLLFSNYVPYLYYQNISTNISEHVSAETVLSRISNQISKLIAASNITSDYPTSPMVLTSTNNFYSVYYALTEAIEILIDYLIKQASDIKTLYNNVAISCSVALLLIYVIAFIIEMVYYERHKIKVFKCLTYLPKTVISNISASFYQIKKESSTTASSNDADSEINKQEENAIKVFSTISDSTGNSLANGLYLITTLLIIPFGILVISLSAQAFMRSCDFIVQNAPHLNSQLGSYSSLVGAYDSLFKIILEKNGFPGVTKNITENIILIDKSLNFMSEQFQASRFGGRIKNRYPFVGMGDSVDKASLIVACENETEAPVDLNQNGNCFDAGLRVHLLNTLIYKRLSSVTIGVYPRPRGDSISDIWVMGPILLYDSFFRPAILDIMDSIQSSINQQQINQIIYSLLFMFLSFVLTILLVVESHFMQKKFIFTLKLLLHCPSNAILQSTKIMTLLSGNYSTDLEESTERKSSFYAHVVNKLTDLVIVAKKEDSIIVSCNEAFLRQFKIDEEQLIGKPLSTFFSSDRFSGNIENMYTTNTMLGFSGNGDNEYILFSSVVVNGHWIISGRDKSRQISHEHLISDERRKSDQLLSSILPACLVPRVQAGEKEITFAVQSVSVLFLDIVEFTPWCGSNNAQYVMKTLNSIFKELDALLNAHKSMTKMKCIGDCYMAAGGIFEDTNNPSQHTKEVVEFGSEAIKKVEEIDERIGEKLQIRVGINTGGPIVAGVLGTDKPTFEILGPTINIAQQMEHHGVPMMIHISRSVYELIYGKSFVIKERGEIPVKNGKMFTYLVSP